MPAPTYVRLTYKPAGAARKLTVWAEVIPAKGDSRLRKFWRVNKEGDKGDPQTLIIVTAAEVETQPARMSLKYGWLCTLDDPDLQNEIDGPRFAETRPENAGA